MAETVTQNELSKTGMSRRERILAIVAAIAVIVVIVGAVAFFMTRVPGDAAAKVNGQYLPESRVAAFIEEYRTNYGFKTDSSFSEYLSYAGLTASQFRERAINELVIRELVEARAKELGLSVSDEEVEAYYATIRGNNDTGEGSLWASVLANAGLTEEKLKERYRYNILQDKVLDADVPQREATDDEVVSYAKTNLAETTQLHVSHIIFKGENAEARANECYSMLATANSEGALSAESFAAAAKTYSDEQGVDKTAGEVGWTGSGTIGTDVLNVFEADDEGTIGAGSLLGLITSSTESGTYEIAYVDKAFTFPAASNINSISDIGAPDSLMEAVRMGANLSVRSSECATYLNNLLSEANVVYYTMPDNASYNVK